eukprot:Filipodium_phascolosomae@DN1013_c0_g1_i2.p1
MLETKVHTLPNNKETGTFYCVDFGGTCVRALLVELLDTERPALVKEVVKTRVPDHLRASSATGTELFDYIASLVKEVMVKTGSITDEDCQKNIKTPPTENLLPLGLTFSFAAEMKTVSSGTWLFLAKNFETSGVVGKDPSVLMNDGLIRAGLPIRVSCVINDTVATLVYGMRLHNADVAVILGTGTNCTYVEKTAGLKDGEELPSNRVINIEWGSFDHCLPRSELVDKIDTSTPFERMVSGAFIGGIWSRIIGYIFGTDVPDNVLSSELATAVALEKKSSGFPKTRKIIKESLAGFDPTNDATVAAIHEAARIALNRSARLVSLTLVAVCLKAELLRTVVLNEKEIQFSTITNNDNVKVAIDGSLYLESQYYQDQVHKNMESLLTPDSGLIDLKAVKDGSGLGAGVLAAALAQE